MKSLLRLQLPRTRLCSWSVPRALWYGTRLYVVYCVLLYYRAHLRLPYDRGLHVPHTQDSAQLACRLVAVGVLSES